ncbi:threonine--tRNA ligase, mitochondrial 1 isoform X2 [Gastrolobium bilobum]|uniref:threonine--tRNA ligase, mitochondrial 1 isoform X2 n=1 Tax=Gastrolobium bilobum TaxID=150636 RepID=UPI002AB151BA|nr:threonine--tRNA ligase, mitochondrial 1 isoform X2 [Gastrolobium bilobum]
MLCSLIRFRRYASLSPLTHLLHFHSNRFSSSSAGASAAMVAHAKDEAYLNAAIPKRIQLFEAIQVEQRTLRLSLSSDPIKVTLPDGNVRDGKKWLTTPLDVAREISKNLANNALIARVNGILWDMTRPLEEDCQLQIFKFDDDEGRDTFWHSSAHILGQALETEYGCKLCIGPCTTRGEGFYYDAFYGDLGLNDDHFKQIEAELPLRLADFGVLHRNEASGALSGLTRVRRFQQDDAHIFCRESQVKGEVRNALNFINHVYNIFGFTYELKLSTRPEKYLGDVQTWEKAENALKEALDESGKPWQLNEGDGAFYGPKIDITVSDALSRKFQCATLQLDFQLPDRFKLEYSAEDEAKIERPVMIHRAILGSVERMFAILLEHYKGKWPFWLSPRQAIVCPVSEKSQAYALQVRDQIHQAGYHVDADTTDRKIQKKVREAQLAQYNYILVVGEEEANTGQVSVRVRDKADHSVMSIENLLTHFRDEVAAFH